MVGVDAAGVAAALDVVDVALGRTDYCRVDRVEVSVLNMSGSGAREDRGESKKCPEGESIEVAHGRGSSSNGAKVTRC
jgi:hypothetical protein